jgi:hypothetical protein
VIFVCCLSLKMRNYGFENCTVDCWTSGMIGLRSALHKILTIYFDMFHGVCLIHYQFIHFSLKYLI